MMTKDKVRRLDWSIRTLGLGTICLAFACERDLAPSALVGESDHFRLHQDLSVVLMAGVAPTDILAGLEVNWSDTQALLGMPDGKVDYYLMTEDHVHAACESDHSAACTDRTMIYTAGYVDPHELNHAYSYLRFGHFPLPLLREGIAQAIGCSGIVGDPSYQASVPWRDAVAASYDYLAAPGLQLVRYLIAKGGVETFLRYYGQAPAGQDADAFASNFATFWGMDMDYAWAAMHVFDPNRLALILPLCPCSLPPLATDGTRFGYDVYRQPYFTLPDLGSESLAVTSAYTIRLADCEQTRTLVGRFRNMLVRMGDGHYLTAALGTATTGHYIADTCDTAEVYDVSGSSSGDLGIAARRPTTGSITLFAELRVPNPGHVQSSESLTVCGTCTDFDGPSCLPQPPNTLISVQDTFYVRMTIGPGGGTPGSWGISFLP